MNVRDINNKIDEGQPLTLRGLQSHILIRSGMVSERYLPSDKLNRETQLDMRLVGVAFPCWAWHWGNNFCYFKLSLSIDL